MSETEPRPGEGENFKFESSANNITENDSPLEMWTTDLYEELNEYLTELLETADRVSVDTFLESIGDSRTVAELSNDEKIKLVKIVFDQYRELRAAGFNDVRLEFTIGDEVSKSVTYKRPRITNMPNLVHIAFINDPRKKVARERKVAQAAVKESAIQEEINRQLLERGERKEITESLVLESQTCGWCLERGNDTPTHLIDIESTVTHYDPIGGLESQGSVLIMSGEFVGQVFVARREYEHGRTRWQIKLPCKFCREHGGKDTSVTASGEAKI